MYLSDEQWELVHNNKRLVYFSLKKQGVFQNSPIWEDMESIATYGLIKAAATYDPTKKTTFATYACTCINNEILMDFKREKNHKCEISLDEPIGYYNDNEEITRGEIMTHPKSYFDKDILNREECARILNIILNDLTTREKLIILWNASGMNQTDIGRRVHIVQSNASQKIKRIIRKIKSMRDVSVPIVGLYSVSFPTETAKIVVSIPRKACFEEHFFNILTDAFDTIRLTIPEFILQCEKEKIIFHLPADTESFMIIACIVQVLEE